MSNLYRSGIKLADTKLSLAPFQICFYSASLQSEFTCKGIVNA